MADEAWVAQPSSVGPRRRGEGGHVDRDRPISVTFDGRELAAFVGDTLASALLANGVRVVATSPERGRPRGVHGVGQAEANAHVRITSAPGEPLVAATMVAAYDGLHARSLAGLGTLSTSPDVSRSDTMWAHCDVLVVGGGPAGVAAARAAVARGQRVVVADDHPALGGRTARRGDDAPTRSLADLRGEIADLEAQPEVRVLTRTTVTGYHPGGGVTAFQRRTDQPVDAPEARARHRIWNIRAGEVVLATGRGERSVAFAGNDRPGVMLAGAAVEYARNYGVLPGQRAVVFACHDGALADAAALADAGVNVLAVVDPRPAAEPRSDLLRRGIEVLNGHAVVRTTGDEEGCLTGAVVAPLGPTGVVLPDRREFGCDLLAVSGGRDPVLGLLTQARGTTRWSEEQAAWIPAEVPPGVRVVGGAAGESPPSAGGPPSATWVVTAPDADPDQTFVDLSRDATLADVHAAIAHGMVSVEHVKRFTTIGTGPDQGRTSGSVLAGILAERLDRDLDEVGRTRARPPLVPVPFAAVAGRCRGDFLDPVRRTPMHDWHVDAGAVFEDVGQWKRARYYPRPTVDGVEDMDTAVARECRTTRAAVGVLDASTLGKIMVEGADAPRFLDRIYANTFSTMRVGRCRYGVMCGTDGMVMDDGVSVRLAEDRYLITTTSGNSDSVLNWLEDWLQTEWPDLCVACTPVTDQFATVSVVGPRARDVLRHLAPDLDVSVEGFAHLDMRESRVAGIEARILRVSFSGELTYEISVPSWYGLALWEAVVSAGRPYGITPYGTETMHVLRAEKGFIVVGHETDGTTTPRDAGLGWAVSKKKDFVGKRSLARPDSAREDRQTLVGLRPRDRRTPLAEGAQLIEDPEAATPVPMVGHVTSAYPHSTEGGPFGLALLAGGAERHGETLWAYHLGARVPVTICEPVFYDPEGARRDG
ncbi:2Fe-2S iron-sulfur cluster-binding protein [Spiractinospora alimapuensis]|uniref:2Fe-2S iron-sulfur cluster-binding protein n=1 Tax=Spiractinospora alimapuensis TaxID=2820884 RepID=UPI001F3BCE21|nr:2Fe-2S iron-sulfur cluster-binding protein [Spiractinospora alimapuensis]